MNITPFPVRSPSTARAEPVSAASSGRAADSFASLLGQLRNAADADGGSRADARQSADSVQSSVPAERPLDAAHDTPGPSSVQPGSMSGAANADANVQRPPGQSQMDAPGNPLVHGTAPEYLLQASHGVAEIGDAVAAERFAEHGLFARTTPTNDMATGAQQIGEAGPAAQSLNDFTSSARDASPLADTATPIEPHSTRLDALQAAVGEKAQPSTRTAPVPTPGAFAASPKATAQVQDEPEPMMPSPSARAARTAQELPFGVALSALPQGLVVTARAEGLDRAGRERLREGLLAMLSQHGLDTQGAEIRIAAPQRTSWEE